MTHCPTPPLSLATSIGSTDSLVTPNHSDSSTFADDDCVLSESVTHDQFSLFPNSSEVWEEFKDADCDPFGIPVADAGIPISPSSSLVSGIDLLGDTSLPLLPEVTAVPIRPGSHPASLFDFPSPPVFIPNRRMAAMWGSRPISGSPSTVSLASHPHVGASHDSLPQPIRRSKSSASRRWSALPSAALHPDKCNAGSNELVASRATGASRTRAARHAVTCTNPPVASHLPFARVSALLLGPGSRGRDVPSPVRSSGRQDPSDAFTSFIDMSTNEPTLSTSRVHKLFSKFSNSLKSRSRYH